MKFFTKIPQFSASYFVHITISSTAVAIALNKLDHFLFTPSFRFDITRIAHYNNLGVTPSPSSGNLSRPHWPVGEKLTIRRRNSSTKTRIFND